MITVNKQVTVTIDGGDIDILKNIAAAAMVYVKSCGLASETELADVHDIPEWMTVGQFSSEQARQMVRLADAVHDL